MFYNVVIIGGGASGLCTAIKSKTDNLSVLVIERNSRAGKKLLSTGNGKCNLTNKYCKTSLFDKNPEGLYPYFSSGRKEFIETVINGFDCEAAVSWFESIGLACKDVNGYFYPLNEQASAVLDTLRFTAEASGVEFMLDRKPLRIEKIKNDFIIDKEIVCEKLVLACGGAAASKTGSDGSGYEFAEKFGHTLIKPRPALCGIKCRHDAFRLLTGLRANCRLSVFEKDPHLPLIRSHGNVQFNGYGVSGIPAMQMAGTVSKLLSQKKQLKLGIEFVPELDFMDVVKFISKRLETMDENARKILPAYYLLTGLVNKKAASAFLKELKLNPESCVYDEFNRFLDSDEYGSGIKCASRIGNLTDEMIFAARCAGVIKHFKCNITDTLGFDESQVTAGGVSTAEINPVTMESLKIPGLYFTGEITDVDGICGGYNLQWAWATAHTAAENIRKNGDRACRSKIKG